jgi:uncharacterized protein
MVEGLPGVGLVGKIAADHLIESYDMTHYANVHCDALPKVAVYGDGERGVNPPVRLYADTERDLLALQSDVPVTPAAAMEFAQCLTNWEVDHSVTPLYLSGLPHEKESDEVPSLYGVGSGDVAGRLDEAGIDPPNGDGLVSGPTGALLHDALTRGATAFGLVVESDPQFPDPEAARVLLKHGIEPLTGLEVDTDDLVEHAEEIRKAKEQLARRMQQASEEATQAQPIRGYQ